MWGALSSSKISFVAFVTSQPHLYFCLSIVCVKQVASFPGWLGERAWLCMHLIKVSSHLELCGCTIMMLNNLWMCAMTHMASRRVACIWWIYHQTWLKAVWSLVHKSCIYLLPSPTHTHARTHGRVYIQTGESTPTITGYFEVKVGDQVVHSKNVSWNARSSIVKDFAPPFCILICSLNPSPISLSRLLV